MAFDGGLFASPGTADPVTLREVEEVEPVTAATALFSGAAGFAISLPAGMVLSTTALLAVSVTGLIF